MVPTFFTKYKKAHINNYFKRVVYDRLAVQTVDAATLDSTGVSTIFSLVLKTVVQRRNFVNDVHLNFIY